MADGPPEMPRPPYREEGILGPGAKRFIVWVLGLAVVGGIVFAVLQVDFGDIGDKIGELTTTTQGDQHAAGGGSGNGGGGGGETTKPAADKPNPDASTLSAAGLSAALAALHDRRGGNPDLVRVRADPDSIELVVRDGNKPAGYTWTDGELTEESFVVVAGPNGLKDADFRASTVKAKSLPRLIRGAERHSGGSKLEVVNATLEADAIEPDKQRWLLNATAPNGSSRTYRAKPDGTGIENLGGTGPPGAGLPKDAQKQLEQATKSAQCIQEAGGDTDAISKCVEQLGP